MRTSRRSFIRSASAIGALAALPGSAFARRDEPKPLDILILGGTGFIGPHEINYAKARGHNVTMFNRGKTAPGMFPDIETLIGDRDDQLDSLKGRDWDAVIDNSGFYPRHTRLSAELLHGHVDQYMFVSSISAYGEELTGFGLWPNLRPAQGGVRAGSHQSLWRQSHQHSARNHYRHRGPDGAPSPLADTHAGGQRDIGARTARPAGAVHRCG